MIDVSIRLRRAIYVDDLHVVQRILKNTPHPLLPTNPDTLGNTSLHLCAQYGRAAIARYLLENTDHDAEGPSRNHVGNTALHVAAMEGMEEVVSVLMERWGEEVVDMRNRAGGTALMEACKRGWVGVVKLLLHHTASPTFTDTLGNTPLHHASAYGHLSVIRVLLEAGAPADRVNRQGWTPISYSYSFEAEQCFQQLVAEIESQRARARAATPVFGRSERVVAGRQRARSGS